MDGVTKQRYRKYLLIQAYIGQFNDRNWIAIKQEGVKCERELELKFHIDLHNLHLKKTLRNLKRLACLSRK